MFGLDFLGGALDDLFTGGKGDQSVNLAGQGRKAFEDLHDIGPSAYLSADPSGRQAQMDALGQLQGQYQAGGLNAIDRARLGDMQDQVAQSSRQAQAGVQQDAMRRGLYNSGNALVGQQVAGQGAAMLGQQQARDAAALAQQTKQGAIMGAGQLAGQVRGGDYEKAAAQDAISRFNGQNAYNRAAGIAGTYENQANQAQNNANRTAGEVKAGLRAIPGVGGSF